MEQEALERVRLHVLGLERIRKDAKGILYLELGRLNSELIDSGLLSVTGPLVGRWSSRECFTIVPPSMLDLDISLAIVVRVHSDVHTLEGMAREATSASVKMSASLSSGPSKIDLGSMDRSDENVVKQWFTRFRDTVTLRLLASRAGEYLDHELRTDVSIQDGL